MVKSFNPYQWYNYQRKRGMHEDAIKDILDIIARVKPKNPWAYGCKVMGIVNGNYNERDHRVKHEATKESREEFALAMDTGMRKLMKGIG